MSLFPPRIAVYMPAFNYASKTVNIYFNFSDYQSAASATSVDISVRFQNNNVSALTDRKLFLKKQEFNKIENVEDLITTSSPYYVTLQKESLEGEAFQANKIYKVQIRVHYDKDNDALVSEWSTVCLLKPIVMPTVTLSGFEEADDLYDLSIVSSSPITYSTDNATFLGTYDPNNNNAISSETLHSYQFNLYNMDNSEESLIISSGEQIFNNYSYTLLEDDSSRKVSFEWQAPWSFETDNITNYKIELKVTTRNGCEIKHAYLFNVQNTGSAKDLESTSIQFYLNEEEAYALVVCRFSAATATSITIRRTSSKSNFQIWEDVHHDIAKSGNSTIEWRDWTIESGVFYNYGVCTRDNYGRRGTLITETDGSEIAGSGSKMVEYDYSYLMQYNEKTNSIQQLKMKYDNTMASFSTVVNENKTDTMGSQYPFVRRNGYNYYRTFPISFLITEVLDDNERVFLDKNKLYNYENALNSEVDLLFKKYQAERELYSGKKYDYIKEREFRRAVEEFVYNDQVILYKSSQEGNILIKLMNISLTPKTELGRLIFQLNATAYEIDKPTLENFSQYNLQYIGTFNTDLKEKITRLGQLSYFDKSAETFSNKNLFEIIQKKYHGDKNYNDMFISDITLNHLRLEFESNPYIVIFDKANNCYIPFTGSETTDEKSDKRLGWLVIIDGQSILVEYPNNIYEMKDPNVKISSQIEFPVEGTQATINFLISYTRETDLSSVPASVSYKSKIVQLEGTWSSNKNIINNLLYYNNMKIEENASKITDYVKRVEWIEIDAEPNTWIQLKTKAMDTVQDFVMNETGILCFDVKELGGVSFEKLYVKGVALNKNLFTIVDSELNPAYTVGYRDWFSEDFYKNNNNFNKDKNYYFANDNIAFYKGQWYPTVNVTGFNSNNYIFIQKDLPALINFKILKERSVYYEL